jgi:hypothetical protein
VRIVKTFKETFYSWWGEKTARFHNDHFPPINNFSSSLFVLSVS